MVYHCLPLSMVDDEMYKAPPTFIVATIDKFANIVLVKEAGAFLGTGTGRFPPSLIIQDELHLISGPLGTIAALYEAGIDETIRHNFNHLGLARRKVKYIASTATIRNADTQVRRLFGRDVALFPPRGVKAADSFFTREEKKPKTFWQKIARQSCLKVETPREIYLINGLKLLDSKKIITLIRNQLANNDLSKT